MKTLPILFTPLLGLLVCSASTNVIVVSESDDRSGRAFFLKECLIRGLTNTIQIEEL